MNKSVFSEVSVRPQHVVTAGDTRAPTVKPQRQARTRSSDIDMNLNRIKYSVVFVKSFVVAAKIFFGSFEFIL